MKQQNDALITLASFLLPPGVLDYFDVADVKETLDNEDKVFKKQLHVYLKERDNRTPDMSDATSNGYTAEMQLLDFPVRTHRMVLRVQRRRWLKPDGTTFIVDLTDRYELAHSGTRYSKDFALFLKRTLR